MTVDQVPWFKGKEVAACLAYTNSRKALRDHVDEEDRKAYAELIKGGNESDPPLNQQLQEVYINESGIYSLVMRSKQKEAKAFKRWVTSEVLPSIRQGCYVQHVVQHKTVCLAKPQQQQTEERILRAGKVLSFDEVEQLNNMENIVQLSSWLDAKVSCPTREAKRKLLYAFRVACKAARLQQAEDEESLVPLVWNQGGHRIVYTRADEELLLDVLSQLRPKFETMMRWYAGMAQQALKRKKQTTMHKYLKHRACSSVASAENPASDN